MSDGRNAFDSIGTLMERFDLDPLPDANAPVFLLGSGWRSGSTLLQRLIMTAPDIIVWGEPYDATGLVRRLAASTHRLDEGWPRESSIVTRDRLPDPNEWIANRFPHPRHLLEGHRALLDRLFAEPAGSLGYRRWGLKEVLADGDRAGYLKRMYPDARFVLLTRNPYDAYLSYVVFTDLGPTPGGWWSRWPDERIDDAKAFGRLWRRITETWGEIEQSLGAVLRIKYEDIRRGEGIEELAAFLDLDLDESVLEVVRRGAPALDSEEAGRVSLTRRDARAIRRGVEPFASRLGYDGPGAPNPR